MRQQSNPPAAGATRELTARTAAVTAGGQVGARAATLLLTGLGTAIVTRAIGQDGFADWGTILMLSAMVAFMLDPGLSPVVVRRIVQSPEDAPAPRSLLRARLLSAGAAYLIVLALAYALRGSDALVLAMVLAAQLLPRSVVLNVGAWMQAEHRLHLQTSYEALTMAAGVVALAAAALLDAPAAVLALVGVFAPVATLAVLMQRELRRLPSAAGRPAERERALVRAVLIEAVPLAGAIVLVSVYTRIGIVFVNETANSGVGDYALAFLFIEQVIVVAAIVAATLLPLLAPRVAERDPAADPVIQDMFAWVVALGALGAAAMIGLADPLVALLGGPKFDGAVKLVELLAPACVLLLANVYIAYLFVACRRSRLYLVYNLVGLAASVALGFALTIPYGVDAAARVTWVTELLVVTLAAAPFFGPRPGGLALLLRFAVATAVVVAASELAAAGRVAAGAAAVSALAVLAILNASNLGRWRRYARAVVRPAGA
jgi:O-antigen/teichoic acid export membrane protein